MPDPWDIGAKLLPLEEGLRRHGALRGAGAEAATRREHKAQTPRSGPLARQGDAAGCPPKKILKPVKKREMVNYLTGRYTVGLRQACRCVRMTRSMYYYRSRMDPQTALRHRMREIAHVRVRFGYRRIYIMLRREGWDVGKDRFYRVYREENLGLRRSVLGVTYLRYTAWSADRRLERTKCGEWTSSPIN